MKTTMKGIAKFTLGMAVLPLVMFVKAMVAVLVVVLLLWLISLFTSCEVWPLVTPDGAGQSETYQADMPDTEGQVADQAEETAMAKTDDDIGLTGRDYGDDAGAGEDGGNDGDVGDNDGDTGDNDDDTGDNDDDCVQHGHGQGHYEHGNGNGRGHEHHCHSAGEE